MWRLWFLLFLLIPHLALAQRVPPGLRDNSVQERHLNASNSPTDEYCLTYENSTVTFEWQTCGSGGGNSFETITVPAGTSPVADSSTDTLTITETSPLVITGTAATDTIAITWSSADIDSAGLIQLVSTDFSYTGDISPTALSADANDYNPTDLATSIVLRLTTDVMRTITGLAGGADGRIIIIVNADSDGAIIRLATENTGSSAANRFSFGGADIYLMPTDAIMLIYDATTSRWLTTGMNKNSFIRLPLNGIWLQDEFIAQASGSGTTGEIGWATSTTGTGASCQKGTVGIDTTNKVMGVTECDTGSTATGKSGIMTNSGGSLVPTLGVSMFLARVEFETLSDGTDTYIAYMGLCDTAASVGGDCTDGIYFVYDQATSANWRIAATGTSTSTKTTTSTAVTTTYDWIMFITNAAWTNVDYFYKPNASTTWTYLGSIADGNIPTATELTYWNLRIEKSAGTNPRTFNVDSFLGFYQLQR